jgi:hypothetical protein
MAVSEFFTSKNCLRGVCDATWQSWQAVLQKGLDGSPTLFAWISIKIDSNMQTAERAGHEVGFGSSSLAPYNLVKGPSPFHV